MSLSPLSPSERTTIRRGSERAATDRAALHEFLSAGLMAHVGVLRDGHPVVLPTAYAVDLDGPDADGTLYIHGSVAARWLVAANGQPVCVTISEIDGLVTARSSFNHSMNYRSAMVLGRTRLVDDAAEKKRALDLMVDHSVPGRAATLRPSTRKELAATTVLALPLAEASLKVRTGGPNDDIEDIATGTWAGHIPLRRTASAPVTSADASGPVPDDVARRAAELGGS